MNKLKYTYCDIIRIKSREEIYELAKTLPTHIDELDFEKAYGTECYVTLFTEKQGQGYYRVQITGSDTDFFLYEYEIIPTGKVYDPGFKITEPQYVKREIVRIKSENLSGYICAIGFPIAPEGMWHYSVFTPEFVCSAMEDDLEPTGNFMPQEEIDKQYDGSSIKVSTTGELLEQNIVDPTWEQRTTKTPGFKKDD